MSIEEKQSIAPKQNPENKDVSNEVQSKYKTIPKEESIVSVKKKPLKKHAEAKNLVKEAKSIIETSDNEIQDCKLLLEEDLKLYEEAKGNLKSLALDESEALLTNLGLIEKMKKNKEEHVVFEPKEDVKPIVLKDVYSGKITGIFISLIAGVIALLGLLYWAIVKRGDVFDFSTIPSNEMLINAVSWFSKPLGYNSNFDIGAALLGGIIVVVMLFVYMIRVHLKAEKNLTFASNQMKEAQKYITHKTNCKIEMDRVDVHIQDAISTLKDYTILLSEKNAILKRIIHFEGLHTDIKVYNDKSTLVMTNTQTLASHIEHFIETPMSEKGKLSGKSTLLLHSAKESLHKELSSHE